VLVQEDYLPAPLAAGVWVLAGKATEQCSARIRFRQVARKNLFLKSELLELGRREEVLAKAQEQVRLCREAGLARLAA